MQSFPYAVIWLQKAKTPHQNQNIPQPFRTGREIAQTTASAQEHCDWLASIISYQLQPHINPTARLSPKNDICIPCYPNLKDTKRFSCTQRKYKETELHWYTIIVIRHT